jgi:hypothetical protein
LHAFARHPNIEPMFEPPDVVTPGTGGSGLDARVVVALHRRLSAALEGASGLDDAGRLDAIRALEQLGCVVTAAQAHLAVELEESQRAQQEAAGTPAAETGRGVAAQVAWARRESPHRGQRHLGLAKAVTAELPHTWRAWRDGRITEWKATMIARETACLSREDRLVVDVRIATDADRLEQMGVRQVVSTVQAEACRLDPASFVTRRRHAESERRVTLRPAPDSMTWLTALLPVKDGVAAYAALTRAAASARASGDARSKGQVMADRLVGAVLTSGVDDVPAVPVTLNLVMSDRDLFGEQDEPAHLDRFGPVPGELARELVADACSRRERVWLRRLYAHPSTGELVAADSRRRVFPPSLARFIRLRDEVCRTPWCEAPVRHADHALSVAEGGPTSLRNAQGLCEACDYAKQAAGWHARPSPGTDGHEISTTLPTGHRYTSRPPPVLATLRRTPIRVDYVTAA